MISNRKLEAYATYFQDGPYLKEKNRILRDRIAGQITRGPVSAHDC